MALNPFNRKLDESSFLRDRAAPAPAPRPAAAMPRLPVPSPRSVAALGFMRPPSIKLPSFSLPQLRLPTVRLPQLRLPQVRLPSLRAQSPSVSRASYNLPSLKMPRLSLPSLFQRKPRLGIPPAPRPPQLPLRDKPQLGYSGRSLPSLPSIPYYRRPQFGAPRAPALPSVPLPEFWGHALSRLFELVLPLATMQEKRERHSWSGTVINIAVPWLAFFAIYFIARATDPRSVGQLGATEAAAAFTALALVSVVLMVNLAALHAAASLVLARLLGGQDDFGAQAHLYSIAYRTGVFFLTVLFVLQLLFSRGPSVVQLPLVGIAVAYWTGLTSFACSRATRLDLGKAVVANVVATIVVALVIALGALALSA